MTGRDWSEADVAQLHERLHERVRAALAAALSARLGTTRGRLILMTGRGASA